MTSPNQVCLVWIDWPLTPPTQDWGGVVYDPDTLLPVSGIRVELYRESDDLFVDFTTTNGAGEFNFLRGADDPYTYYAHAFQAGVVERHGTTDSNLPPT